MIGFASDGSPKILPVDRGGTGVSSLSRLASNMRNEKSTYFYKTSNAFTLTSGSLLKTFTNFFGSNFKDMIRINSADAHEVRMILTLKARSTSDSYIDAKASYSMRIGGFSGSVSGYSYSTKGYALRVPLQGFCSHMLTASGTGVGSDTSLPPASLFVMDATGMIDINNLKFEFIPSTFPTGGWTIDVHLSCRYGEFQL